MAKPFSKLLQEHRTANNYTQKRMAEILGISERMYTYYEKGAYDGNPAKVQKYLDKLSGNFPVAPPTGTVPHRKAKPIAFYNLDVSASDVDVFNDLAETSLQISIPGFNDCEFAFPIYGHSMYPIYESGCIIICKRITDLDVINYGEAYLVITKEQRLLKRVMKGEVSETILLTSDNNELGRHGRQKYESFELKKEKIKHLFLVKGSIKQNQI